MPSEQIVFPASKAQLQRGERAGAQSPRAGLGVCRKEHCICTRVCRGRRRSAMFRCGLFREEADTPGIVAGPGRAMRTLRTGGACPGQKGLTGSLGASDRAPLAASVAKGRAATCRTASKG